MAEGPQVFVRPGRSPSQAAADVRRTGSAGPVDPRLTVLALSLVAFGLLMVYSASSMLSMMRFENGHAFLESQAIKAVLGIAIMFAIARVDYHAWSGLAGPMLWGSLALLALTVLPGTESLTPEINGARRWIALPGFSFQPSELVRLVTVLWLAASLAGRPERLASFRRGTLRLCIPPAIGFALLVLQPDFGSGLFLALMVATMLFLGGVPLRHLFALAACAVPALVWLAVAEPYRIQRLLAFRDPDKYLESLSYQVHQSLISLGSGGLLGVGVGSSKQKFLFLPEAHTDFIFAIIGEELGFAGAGLTLAAFVYLAVVGYRTARRAPDDFGLLLGGGLTATLVLGSLFNIGVATGNLPTTGLTLPFISYGATSLTVSLAAVGVLMNLSRPRRPADRVLHSLRAAEGSSGRPR
ncbi:MAG: putative lipid II flippase FtsW, partial [Gemmatimonadetes bacterium]|nr:putative lipid II flippase FtsW [Gemmatimonadota bacterium]